MSTSELKEYLETLEKSHELTAKSWKKYHIDSKQEYLNHEFSIQHLFCWVCDIGNTKWIDLFCDLGAKIDYTIVMRLFRANHHFHLLKYYHDKGMTIDVAQRPQARIEIGDYGIYVDLDLVLEYRKKLRPATDVTDNATGNIENFCPSIGTVGTGTPYMITKSDLYEILKKDDKPLENIKIVQWLEQNYINMIDYTDRDRYELFKPMFKISRKYDNHFYGGTTQLVINMLECDIDNIDMTDYTPWNR